MVIDWTINVTLTSGSEIPSLKVIHYYLHYHHYFICYRTSASQQNYFVQIS